MKKKGELNWPLEAARLSGRSFIPSCSGDILSLIKCLAHCSLITSHKHDHTNSKDVIDIEAQNPSTQKNSQFQRLFCKLQVRCSGGSGGVCLLQPGEQRGHLCFEDSSTSVSTLSRHHGYFRPWSSVFSAIMLVGYLCVEDYFISVLTPGIMVIWKLKWLLELIYHGLILMHKKK